MNSEISQPQESNEIVPQWKPLPSIQRRVLGVLVEKAKTTPDAYPISLNALTNGCNQKSNRAPQMNLTQDQVDDALEALRHLNAASEIQGTGRVPKYRHFMKDWLGVDGPELAVMTELLLRGPQTVGELRSRAARMGNIPDIAALRPILDSLIGKKLVVSLTTPGRGQIVTHALYTVPEMDALIQQYKRSATATNTASSSPSQSSSSPSSPAPTTSLPASASSGQVDSNEVTKLRGEVDQMRQELDRLRKDVEDLWETLR